MANAYRRAVPADGNPAAKALLDRLFHPVDSRWRGLGILPSSGLALRRELADWSARNRFAIDEPEVPDPPGCACGEVLQGICRPADCRLFGRSCTPSHPVGPCMVSAEGACAAAFRYGDEA